MNEIDAICTTCHQPFRWLSGTPRRCHRCSPQFERHTLDPHGQLDAASIDRLIQGNSPSSYIQHRLPGLPENHTPGTEGGCYRD